MMVTHDIFTLTVLFIVLIFACYKGREKKDTAPTKMKNGEDFKDWYMKLCEKNRKRNEGRLEEIRYEKWLIDHQQK